MLNKIYKKYKESSIVVAPNLVSYDQVASAEGMTRFLNADAEFATPLRRSTMDT